MDSTELVSARIWRDFQSRRLNPAEEAEGPMKKLRATRWESLEPFVRDTAIAVSGTLLLAGTAFAQAAGGSPWENAVNVLQTAFTGPIAKGLALVDFALLPHLDHTDHPESSTAKVERMAAEVPVPLYGIDDETAIKVVDGSVQVVSEGHWKMFTH